MINKELTSIFNKSYPKKQISSEHLVVNFFKKVQSLVPKSYEYQLLSLLSGLEYHANYQHYHFFQKNPDWRSFLPSLTQQQTVLLRKLFFTGKKGNKNKLANYYNEHAHEWLWVAITKDHEKCKPFLIHGDLARVLSWTKKKLINNNIELFLYHAKEDELPDFYHYYFHPTTGEELNHKEIYSKYYTFDEERKLLKLDPTNQSLVFNKHFMHKEAIQPQTKTQANFLFLLPLQEYLLSFIEQFAAFC